MQSTKPPYTSIRNVPAGTILGNSGGATAAAQALDASTVRTVIGLGTAATAATGDFDAAGAASSAVASHVAASDPHGDRAYAAGLVSGLGSVYQPLDSDLTAIAALTTTTFGRALLALADAAAGRTAFGLGTAATAAIAATGTADRAQKRSGTGNTLVDSLFGVTDTTGIASLMGTTACYRANDSSGSKYAEMKHDGTHAIFSASSGSVKLVPESGGYGTIINDGILRMPTAFQVQTTGGSQFLSVTSGGRLQCTSSTVGTTTFGLHPLAGGGAELNNGTNGTLATLTGIFRTAPYTFATVPTASANTGSTIRITDRSNRQAYSDGTNWRFTADDVIIS